MLATLTPTGSRLRRYHVSAAVRPAWLKGRFAEGMTCRTAFSAAERRIYRRRKRIPPSEWVPRHRYVTHGDLKGHMADLSVSPHIAAQMDAAVLPSVRCIVVCAGPQTAKSFMVDSVMLYLMDMDPGEALSIYPDKDTGVENLRDRIKAAVLNSPRLKKLLPGNRDDISATALNTVSMSYHIGWAGSAISTANRSIRYLDMQEVEKWPDSPNKKEAGSIELAEIRVTAFPDNHKIFITSSPTIEAGQIWQALLECEVIFEYWVRCPYCGEEQVMEFEEGTSRFRWPHYDDGSSYTRNVIMRDRLARYHCAGCDMGWDDLDRNQAVDAGGWRAKTTDGSRGLGLMAYIARHRSQKIGFVQPSWISKKVSLSKVVADFLKSQDPSLSRFEQKRALKNFYNKHKAEPFLDYAEMRREDELLVLCEERPVSIVPGGGQVAGLFFFVDTQDVGYWYMIIGIGYGTNPVWWVVQAGYVLDEAALEEVLWANVYRDVLGRRYLMQFGLMDARGHRTSAVYDFCRRHPGRIQPAMGERILQEPYSFKKIEHYPDGKPFPYGLQRVRINTTYYKDRMDRKLQVVRDDPGAVRLYAGFPPAYLSQLCAESRDEYGVWGNPKGRANHLWDCLVGVQVAADIKWVHTWGRPEEQRQQQQQQQPRGRQDKRERW